MKTNPDTSTLLCGCCPTEPARTGILHSLAQTIQARLDAAVPAWLAVA